MKAVKTHFHPARFLLTLSLIILSASPGNAQVPDPDNVNLIKPETEISSDIFWQVKAYHPQVKLLAVKAIDLNGNVFDVKAIQSSDNTNVLDVKALKDGERLPIKLIVHGNDKYFPLKAITEEGGLMDIKAITEEGFMLDVKGVSKTGNIIHIRALDKDGAQYNILAVSPYGEINDVKGLKMLEDPIEVVIKGIQVFAHVKAMKPD